MKIVDAGPGSGIELTAFGSTGVRHVRIHAGQAACWSPKEEHETWTGRTGLTAFVVEAEVPHPAGVLGRALRDEG
ncbi:hypothetical protein OG607_10690 [Streptomyces sp. NBC_01537]|uniref:hypothetical protein n=1 Tax=Streptomyces sp. NBC_01537 TaxID=2903896 RepID=UPI0038665729